MLSYKTKAASRRLESIVSTATSYRSNFDRVFRQLGQAGQIMFSPKSGVPNCCKTDAAVSPAIDDGQFQVPFGR